MGLDHAGCSRDEAHPTRMVRPSGDDEANPQYSTSRFEESRKGAAYQTEQFHDAAPAMQIWSSGKCRPQQIHVNYAILLKSGPMDQIEMHQHSRPRLPRLRTRG